LSDHELKTDSAHSPAGKEVIADALKVKPPENPKKDKT
jgi:hypothetical protein